MLTEEQAGQAQAIAGVCRAVWNTALEQRRWAVARWQRGQTVPYPDFVFQCRQLAEAKPQPELAWLRDAPGHCLQQALKDLDRAVARHGTFNVHWRSARRWKPSFRFPEGSKVTVERLGRKRGRAKLPKLGWVVFRWSRPPGGRVRNATLRWDGRGWLLVFQVDDGLVGSASNGKPPVGVDRGVATSEGQLHDPVFATGKEEQRLIRLQRAKARQRKGSANREKTKAAIAAVHRRRAARREDFNAKLADTLTREYGLVALETLNTAGMTRSARGTVETPGRQVRQKAGLNRAILDKGWADLASRVEYKAVVNGSHAVRVEAAFTSQMCSRCAHVAPESRESQADFRCVACGHSANADVNAAINIRERGRAVVSARGDLQEQSGSVKREAVGNREEVPLPDAA